MTRRRALVTGAARGQGLEIARWLRREGYAVAAGDILEAELRQNYPDAPAADMLVIRLDVTDARSWSAAIATVQDQFGGLDVLVNNAGVLARGPLLEETAEQAERLWRVNCLGHLLGIQAASPLLRSGHHPAIVNNLSTSATYPAPTVAAYSSSKWAARGMSQAAALELAPFGIRVNSVLPGSIATPMHDSSTIDRLSKGPLLGRIGRPADIAAAVAFLASPVTAWMTGAEIVVDGGSSLRRGTSQPTPAALHPGSGGLRGPAE